ncbi:hypothetical protein AB833_20955 [Chromatiales bacterium (ex Bugula neritina AB1)]|nr:hypothetical protein AB833_20955 [Chromatiales bacterium (ex Bugula neritina AB1)]
MLKGIPSIISADLLWVLRSMGHGDDLVISDRNFPAHSVARSTSSGYVIPMDGVNDTEAVRAILQLYPLDSFVESPVHHMQVVGEPETRLAVHREVLEECSSANGAEIKMESIERFAFYEAAKKSYAVVQTSEDRPYGCFILKKGVVF